ncbi:putative membrane protein [Pontibacter lucknowensis]|uniref:Putative membrane protein n=2 Tax=Pontibacter lucknowensis TaxID=1077936 RepID=A0A1N7ABK7_9BACT|nr:putative membrane protein [Pontibacter lucknowensis]
MTFIMTFRSKHKLPFMRRPLHMAYMGTFIAFLAYTGFTTPDLLNWLLENSLTLSVVILLAAFYNIFRFTDTSYTLVFLFMMLHVYGSYYQYADNPFGEWMKGQFNFQRNHYDRIVHFGFGLLLTYPIYEIARRGFSLSVFLSSVLTLSLVLSLSAVYEIVEWIVADLVYDGDEQGMAYLGMQGDIWDAQKDMVLAFLGASIAIGVAIVLRKRTAPSTNRD